VCLAPRPYRHPVRKNPRWLPSLHDDGPIRLWRIGYALTACFAAAIAGLAALWAVALVVLHHPPLEHKAISVHDAVGVAQLVFASVAGAGALVALTVAYRRQKVAEADSAHDRTRVFNERFTAIATQLGDDQPAVRLAGVHAMAGLADDWAENQQTCVDVLCAYLRLPYDPDPGEDGTLADRATYRANREVRHTIIRLIRDHLRPNAAVSWQGFNLDFTGVVFDGGGFGLASFSGGTVRFTSAEFSGGTVDFGGAEFSGGTVDFGGAQFSRGVVDFGGAGFSGGTVDFRGAQFSSPVDFRSAEFSGGRVDFRGVEFSGSLVNFRGVEFSGGVVEFYGAQFSGMVDFRGAQFSGGRVDFRSAGFSSSTVYFVGAEFSGAVDFRGAHFIGGTVDFRDAQFSAGAVDFRSAEFSSGRVDFRGAGFSGSLVDFRGAQFSGSLVDFRDSRSWSQPPVFGWEGAPPVGVTLPADEDATPV
jgi:uncharacterized protein YjbI with pentapeptide repeats